MNNTEIRSYIDAVMRTDTELDAFIIDNFHDTYMQFSRSMDRTDKINQLLLREDKIIIIQKIRAQIGSRKLIVHLTRRKFYFIIAATFVLSPICVFAFFTLLFNTMDIKILKYSGTVLNASGEPLSQAEIIMLANGCTAVTGKYGFFSFGGMDRSCHIKNSGDSSMQQVIIHYPKNPSLWCGPIEIQNEPSRNLITIDENCKFSTENKSMKNKYNVPAER